MRTVEEWIGSTDDSRPPFAVRMRILMRALGECQKCTHKIVPGDKWQCDHVKPLWEGGENRESNMQLLCGPCHDRKTRAEAPQRAKINRVRQKHFGLKKPRTIRAWRKFNGDPVFAKRER